MPDFLVALTEVTPYLFVIFGYCVFAFLFILKFADRTWSYLLVAWLYVPVFTVSGFYMGADVFNIIRLYALGLFLGGALILIIFIVLSWSKLKVLRSFFIFLLVLLVGLAVDGFVIEPRWLETRRETMTSDKISKPIKIAVLSDIQTDDMGSFEIDMLKKVKEYRPDLVLFVGDYVHAWPHNRAKQVQLFNQILKDAKLEPSLGTIAVQGDADQYPEWKSCFDGLPYHVFQDSGTMDSGELTITYLSLRESREGGYTVPKSDKFHILTGHCPNFAMNKDDVDLLIGGHTHGGQVHIPFYGPPITLSKLPRQWGGGCMAKVDDDTMLCVSRGIGMERANAPRMRFLCHPELVFIDVLPINSGK